MNFQLMQGIIRVVQMLFQCMRRGHHLERISGKNLEILPWIEIGHRLHYVDQSQFVFIIECSLIKN